MIKTRLFGLVPDSKKYIFANVVLQWIGLICSVTMILTIAGLLNDMQSGTDLSIPRTAGIIFVAVILQILCVKLAATASYYASKSVKRTLRGMIYEKMLRLGNSYREQATTAEVVQLAGEGVEQLETYFGSYLPQFFYALLAPLTLFAVVSRISMKVAITLLVCVPLIPMAIVAVQKIAKRLLKNYWGQYAQLGDYFLENLQGLTTLKVYRADGQRHKEMNEQAEKFRIITMKVLSMQLNSIIVMDIIAYGGAALGILLAIGERNAGNIGFAGGFAIILLSADFFLPMRKLGSFFHVAMNGMAASDKIFALLDLPEEEGRDQIPENNSMELKKLSFGYTKEREILHQITMEFAPGSFTAIVGESGCGKSTIASILTGRLTGYTGSAIFGEKELSSVSERELMTRVTLISHNSYMFNGTVRDNLLMGKPDADDEELWKVLDQVKLSDFIHNQGGLNMILNEGAANISGGQRQRLALARALLHNSPVFIFDEATSNIDVESENDIMTLIHELAKTKTIILISHRLANVVRADQIYVLENGDLVQHGSHRDLLGQSGLYSRLWKGQQELESVTKAEPEQKSIISADPEPKMKAKAGPEPKMKAKAGPEPEHVTTAELEQRSVVEKSPVLEPVHKAKSVAKSDKKEVQA